MERELLAPLSSLLCRAQQTPDAPALIVDDKTWSCARLAAEIKHLAVSLQALGLKCGERVALHMLNIPELVLTSCACFHLGVIAVPLNARYKPDEVEAMIARIKPVLYIRQPNFTITRKKSMRSSFLLGARFIAHSEIPANGVHPWSDLLPSGLTPFAEHVAESKEAENKSGRASRSACYFRNDGA